MDDITSIIITDPNGAKCDHPRAKCETKGCKGRGFAIAVVNARGDKAERSERLSLCALCLLQLRATASKVGVQIEERIVLPCVCDGEEIGCAWQPHRATCPLRERIGNGNFSERGIVLCERYDGAQWVYVESHDRPLPECAHLPPPEPVSVPNMIGHQRVEPKSSGAERAHPTSGGCGVSAAAPVR